MEIKYTINKNSAAQTLNATDILENENILVLKWVSRSSLNITAFIFVLDCKLIPLWLPPLVVNCQDMQHEIINNIIMPWSVLLFVNWEIFPPNLEITKIINTSPTYRRKITYRYGDYSLVCCTQKQRLGADGMKNNIALIDQSECCWERSQSHSSIGGRTLTDHWSVTSTEWYRVSLRWLTLFFALDGNK